ncbi:hypothetical protein ACQJBY_017392 [Aegilops geniculata]
MDVTFRENEPYYESNAGSGISLSPPDEQQERVNEGPVLVLAPTSGDPLSTNSTRNQGEENDGVSDDNSCHGDEDDGIGHLSFPSQDEESQMREDPGNDTEEIVGLKHHLAQEFEVKDLGHLRYFLGIEVLRGPKGIFMTQRKYILDLLKETGMYGSKPATTPIEQNHKLSSELGNPVNRERYQRLVGKLIYLSHTRPDIAFAVSIVSQFMHNPRTAHLDAVNRILRYLKGCPGKGLLYTKQGNLQVECYTDAAGLVL